MVTGQYAFAPVAAGFFLGALFVYGADVLMTYAGVNSPYDLGKYFENDASISYKICNYGIKINELLDISLAKL